MMNRTVRKVISLVAALCLALTAGAGALAEGAQDMADFEALTPLMDLVCAASQYSPNAPESVPGADGVLTVSFTDAFFKVGQTYGAEVGVTADMINDTNAQAELLSKILTKISPQIGITFQIGRLIAEGHQLSGACPHWHEVPQPDVFGVREKTVGDVAGVKCGEQRLCVGWIKHRDECREIDQSISLQFENHIILFSANFL